MSSATDRIVWLCVRFQGREKYFLPCRHILAAISKAYEQTLGRSLGGLCVAYLNLVKTTREYYEESHRSWASALPQQRCERSQFANQLDHMKHVVLLDESASGEASLVSFFQKYPKPQIRNVARAKLVGLKKAARQFTVDLTHEEKKFVLKRYQFSRRG